MIDDAIKTSPSITPIRATVNKVVDILDTVEGLCQGEFEQYKEMLELMSDYIEHKMKDEPFKMPPYHITPWDYFGFTREEWTDLTKLSEDFYGHQQPSKEIH